jgi:hypothetical protein
MQRPPITLLLLMTLYLSVFGAGPAYAYLDIGTGSMLLQGLLAGAGIVVAGATHYWRRFLSFFRRDSKKFKGERAPE